MTCFVLEAEHPAEPRRQPKAVAIHGATNDPLRHASRLDSVQIAQCTGRPIQGVTQSHCPPPFFARAQRALIARFASARRSALVCDAARALPPKRPNATAAGFFALAFILTA